MIRDDVDSYSDSDSDSESKACYHYGGVYPGGLLKVLKNVPELSSCEVCDNLITG